MKKLLVFMSIAIFAIALGGCQKEAKVADEQQAPAEQVVTEEVQETPAAVELTPIQPEEVVVQEEIAVVEEPTAEPETPAAVEAIVEEIDVDAVVVTVNGQEITEKEVSEEVTKLVEVQKKRMPPGMEMPDSLQQQVRTRVVETKIEQTLLSQEIEKNDIAPVTDEEVIEEIKKIAGQRGQSMEDVEKEIAQMGMTLEDLKGQIRSQMEMKDLMERVSLRIHPDWVEGKDTDARPDVVVVKLKDGREYSYGVAFARGHAQVPLTDEELLTKYRECAKLVLRDQEIERCIELIQKLEKLEDIKELMDILIS